MTEREEKLMHKFFVVTIHGSLYEVTDQERENDWPIVRKISGPKNPEMPNGTCLKNGEFVVIDQAGICLFNYHPKVRRDFEGMNTINWGGKTGRPVALFLDRDSAEKCVAVDSLDGMSDRYREQTIAVLEEIGDNHAVFTISDSFKLHYDWHVIHRPRNE